MRRLTEATRYTVYYTRPGSLGQEYFECRANDRGRALGELVLHLGTDRFIVTRVVPGWPEHATKGKSK